MVSAPWRRRRAAGAPPARRAGRGARLHAAAGRTARGAPTGDRLRPARVRPVGHARRHVALDRRPVCDRGRPGARRARARPLPPPRPVVGRMARNRLHGPRPRGRRRPCPRQHVGEHRRVRRRRPQPDRDHRAAPDGAAELGAGYDPRGRAGEQGSTGATCAGSTRGPTRSCGARPRWRGTRSTRR